MFGKPFNASQSISPRTPARDKWQIVLSVRRTFKQYKLLESSAELGWRYFKFFDFPPKNEFKVSRHCELGLMVSMMALKKTTETNNRCWREMANGENGKWQIFFQLGEFFKNFWRTSAPRKSVLNWRVQNYGKKVQKFDQLVKIESKNFTKLIKFLDFNFSQKQVSGIFDAVIFFQMHFKNYEFSLFQVSIFSFHWLSVGFFITTFVHFLIIFIAIYKRFNFITIFSPLKAPIVPPFCHFPKLSIMPPTRFRAATFKVCLCETFEHSTLFATLSSLWIIIVN